MTSLPVQAKLAEALLEVARGAIIDGLKGIQPGSAHTDEVTPELRRRQASFVTLSDHDGGLRGCCGSLEPRSSLAADLASNAWRTAFGDPRFEPVTADELPGLELEIALLSPLVKLPVASREELQRGLVAHRHGLLLECGGLRATFLPKVWTSLPDPHSFVGQLMRKGGISGWSEGMQAWTYTTECFQGPLSP